MRDRMPEISRESERVQKTCKALFEALSSVLNRRNFNNVTVNDLCLEARISRATFYSHFRDKYDLLDRFFAEIGADIAKDIHVYDELQRVVSDYVDANKKIIANVLKDANSETLALLRGFLSSIVAPALKMDSDEASAHHIILNNFVTGGLLNLITWIVENNYPPKVTVMNSYLYQMIKQIATWDAAQADRDVHEPKRN